MLFDYIFLPLSSTVVETQQDVLYQHSTNEFVPVTITHCYVPYSGIQFSVSKPISSGPVIQSHSLTCSSPLYLGSAQSKHCPQRSSDPAGLSLDKQHIIAGQDVVLLKLYYGT